MLVQRFGLALYSVNFFGVVDFFCDKFELFAAAFLQGPVKTGLVACVALAGVNSYFENKAVLVAIDKYLLYFLEVPTFLTFFP